MKAQKRNFKWLLCGIISIIAVAVVGLCCGCNASVGSSDPSSDASASDIVESYFTSVDVTYINDSNELNFTINSDKVAGKDVAHSFYSNRLVNCIKDIMTLYPDVNINKVTIESVNVPNIIVCDFDADKVKEVSDWDSFDINKLSDLCTSYTDCMM